MGAMSAPTSAPAPIGGLFGAQTAPVMPAVLDYLRSMMSGDQAPSNASAQGLAAPASISQGQAPPLPLQSPQAAPQPQDQQPPAPMAAPDASGMPTYPLPPQRNVLLDTIDNLFLGGNIEKSRQANYGQRLATIQIQNALRYISQNVKDPVEQAAAFANPLQYMATVNARMQPTKLGPGDTLIQGGLTGGNLTAPQFDSKSGRLITVAPDGSVSASASAGGDDSVDASGNVISSRTGPVTTVPTFQHFPRTDNHGFVQPTAPGGPAGPAPGSPGAPAAGPAGAPPPIPARAAPAEVAAAIQARAAAAGLAPDAQANMVMIGKLESSLNPRSRNNGQSTGLYQFHPATFAAAGGTDITDPTQQTDAAISLYKKNEQDLTDANIVATPTAMYLAHQQGIAGARALYGADPSTKAVDAIAPIYTGRYGQIRGNALARKAIVNNGGSVGMTTGQFLSKWDGKVAAALPSGADAGAPADQGAPSAPEAPGALGSESLSGGDQFGAPHQIMGPGGKPLPGLYVTDPANGKPDPIDGTAWTPKDALEIRSSVTGSEEYKQAQAAVTAYRAMIGNADHMTGPSAYSMLDTFARAINPGAVARPTVIKTIEENIGVPAQVMGKILSATGQGALPKETRQQILDAVLPFVQSHWDQANTLNQQAARIGKRHDFEVDDVTAPLDARPRRFQVDQGPASKGGGGAPVRLDPQAADAQYAGLAPGARYIAPDGTTRTKR